LTTLREYSPASERAGVSTMLDEQRAGLTRKVTGVSEVDARLQPTAGSLSLLSLIKHCAVWEARWFGGVVAGQRLPDGWPEVDEDDAEFLLGEDDTLELWLSRYEAACNASRVIVASMDLDAPCARPDVIDCNLRWVMLHLIEETARHAGHADLIREALDGSRGM